MVGEKSSVGQGLQNRPVGMAWFIFISSTVDRHVEQPRLNGLIWFTVYITYFVLVLVLGLCSRSNS